MIFNSKSKVYEFNIVTKYAASQAHKLYFINLYVAKIIFYIDRKKYPIFISFVLTN